MVEPTQQLGDIHRLLLRHHRTLDGLFERIGRSEEQIEGIGGHCLAVVSQQVEQILDPMRDIGDDGIAHGRRHPFDSMYRAEERPEWLRGAGILLPGEKLLIQSSEMLAAFGQE